MNNFVRIFVRILKSKNTIPVSTRKKTRDKSNYLIYSCNANSGQIISIE